MLATKELRASKTNHSQQFNFTAKKLADFLESVEAEEVMLKQRLCDAEGRKVLEKINGGSAAQDNGIPSTALQSNKNNTAEMKNETETLEVYGEF
jgi:hypothetical protein